MIIDGVVARSSPNTYILTMVYIPPYIIEKLDALSVYDVAERLGVDVVRNHALCFMHDDHHPSMVFKKSSNSWKCYVCNVGGHSIELVKRYKDYSFQEACIWLARSFNIEIPNTQNVRLKIAVAPKVYSKVESSPKVVDEEVLEWIICHAGLSEMARHFLFEERKYSEDAVRAMNIGSISDGAKFVSALTKVFSKERCIKAGVLIEYGSNLFPVFRVPCLLFPYYDIDGNIRNIQSRFLGKLDKKKKYRFNNCKGLTPLMFNMPVIKSSGRYEKIYVAEGVTDCLAYLSEGKKTIALPGAGSFRPEYAQYLKDKTLFIYVDNDDAGRSLLEKMNVALRKVGNCIHNIRKDATFKDYSDYYLSKIKENEKDSRSFI